MVNSACQSVLDPPAFIPFWGIATSQSRNLGPGQAIKDDWTAGSGFIGQELKASFIDFDMLNGRILLAKSSESGSKGNKL